MGSLVKDIKQDMSRISELRIEREDIQKRLWATQNDADKRALARKVAQLGVKTIEDSRRPVESSRPNHAFAASLSQAEIDELKAIEEQSRRQAAWQERQRQAVMRNTTVESVREEHKREDVLCNVCQVEPLSNPEIVAELGCGHRMCRPCMKNCIESALKNSLTMLDNIKCPYCDHVITRQEILKFGTQAHAKKYDEKKDSAQNQTVYEETDPKFLEWKKKQNDLKACPGCKIHISRIEGCNHMKCPRCETDFCIECEGPYRNGKKYGIRKGEKYGVKFPLGCGHRICNGGLDARMQELLKADRTEFQVGAEVEGLVQIQGRGVWYPARIDGRARGYKQQDMYKIRWDDGSGSLPKTIHMANIRVLNKATIKRCPQCGRTPEEFEDYYNDYGKYNKDCCGDKFHPRTG